jgi:hypothetical protein
VPPLASNIAAWLPWRVSTVLLLLARVLLLGGGTLPSPMMYRMTPQVLPMLELAVDAADVTPKVPAAVPPAPDEAPAAAAPREGDGWELLRLGPAGGRCRRAMEGLLGLLLPGRGSAGRVGCELAAVEAVVVRSRGEGLLEVLVSWALQTQSTPCMLCW